MITFLVLVLGVVLFDRAIPLGGIRFGTQGLGVSGQDYMKKYGIIRFPRTLFAGLIVAVPLIAMLFHMDQTAEGLMGVTFTVLFVSTACLDAWKAARAG